MPRLGHIIAPKPCKLSPVAGLCSLARHSLSVCSGTFAPQADFQSSSSVGQCKERRATLARQGKFTGHARTVALQRVDNGAQTPASSGSLASLFDEAQCACAPGKPFLLGERKRENWPK